MPRLDARAVEKANRNQPRVIPGDRRGDSNPELPRGPPIVRRTPIEFIESTEPDIDSPSGRHRHSGFRRIDSHPEGHLVGVPPQFSEAVADPLLATGDDPPRRGLVNRLGDLAECLLDLLPHPSE
jgi:hypothetical protein